MVQALRHDAAVAESVGLTAVQRRWNQAGHIQLLAVPPSPVLLVDDVITTGATAAGSIAVLRSAGVEVAGMLGLSAA